MKQKELKTKSDAELKSALEESRAQLASIRFSRVGGKSKNVKESLAIRRKIARILTIFSNKQNIDKKA